MFFPFKNQIERIKAQLVFTRDTQYLKKAALRRSNLEITSTYNFFRGIECLDKSFPDSYLLRERNNNKGDFSNFYFLKQNFFFYNTRFIHHLQSVAKIPLLTEWKWCKFWYLAAMGCLLTFKAIMYYMGRRNHFLPDCITLRIAACYQIHQTYFYQHCLFPFCRIVRFVFFHCCLFNIWFDIR